MIFIILFFTIFVQVTIVDCKIYSVTLVNRAQSNIQFHILGIHSNTLKCQQYRNLSL